MPRSASLIASRSATRRPLLALAAGVLALAPALALGQAKPRPGTLGGTTRPTGPGSRPATPARPTAPPMPADSTRPLPVGGIVTDSVAGAPLAGATVQLASEVDRTITHTSVSDSTGRWRVPAVKPGRYLAGFFHPTLDALGIEPPVILVQIFPDTAARLDLSLIHI